jgi:signal transduction histidine kinase
MASVHVADRIAARVVAAWRRARATPRSADRTDAVVTFAVGVLCVAIGAVDVLQGTGAPTLLGPWDHVLTLAVGCLLMLAKRRAPALALPAGVALFAVDARLGGSLGLVLVLFDLVFSAALHGSARLLRVLQVAAAVAVAGTAVAVGLASGEVRIGFFAGLQVFAFGVSPLWWGMNVRHHAQARRLAEERAEDLRRLAELREQEARTEERTRMARDLHDAIAGNLSAIALHAEAALARPADDDAAPARDRAALRAVRAASVASLTEMRTMIGLLRAGQDPVAAPSRLADVPTLVATTRAAGHEVEVVPTVPDPLPELPAAVDQAGYRIVQESLTNAVKHAPAGRSRVAVRVAGAELHVAVDTWSPRPVGAGPRAGQGLGLLTMRERAESLGGTFAAGPADDGAWAVRATLPLVGDVGRPDDEDRRRVVGRDVGQAAEEGAA